VAFRILLVLTSQNRLGDADVAAGTWLEELAAPYFVLSGAGCQVDFASIKGGEAPIDPASLGEPWLTDYGRRLLDDPKLMARLAATPALSSVKAGDYDALYMIGGAAVMWDFPSDPVLGLLLRSFAADGRITAGVCHGVSGFLNPGAGDLVKGRHLTCISDNEDALAGYDKLVPFMPEAPLRAAGAQLSFAAEPFGCHALRDGNVITGENPASAGRCAELILETLKEKSAGLKTAAI
jgi:putative intracellular protease/amidase